MTCFLPDSRKIFEEKTPLRGLRRDEALLLTLSKIKKKNKTGAYFPGFFKPTIIAYLCPVSRRETG